MLLDYELIGNLQTSNGIVSGFNNSTSNYIKIPFSLPMGSNKVEFCLSLYYPSLSSMSTILANYNDAGSGGGLVLRSATTSRYSDIQYWGWNSSGTMIAEGVDPGFDLTVGTNVIKFVYENSTITWYKSINGVDFTQGISRSGSIADFKNYLVIGASGTAWYSGNMQVNMLDSYIKVNDEYWHSKEYSKQKTKIIQRHDTAANWTSVNPVLAAGEMGVETDTNKFKFGDGVTAWNSLSYATSGSGGGGDSYTKAETDSLLSTKSDKILNMADFYKIGTPTVSGNTYTSSANNYLACNISSLNMYQPYEIVVCLNVKSSISGYNNGISILGTNNGLNYQGLKIALDEVGYVVPYLSTNGTSWNYNSSASSLRLNSAGTYYIKFQNTTSDYYMYYSTNGGSTWTTCFSKTGFTGALINPGYFVLGGNNGDYLRNANFDISKFYIKQGGNYIISGTLNSTKPVSTATTSSLGVVQPDGTSITVSKTGVISGQDVKTFTGYSDTGTLVLKSINGVLQWVAEG